MKKLSGYVVRCHCCGQFHNAKEHCDSKNVLRPRIPVKTTKITKEYVEIPEDVLVS